MVNNRKKKFMISFKGLESQYIEIKTYFENMPIDIIITGLRFTNNRYKAKVGGYLNPGRKSIIKKETYLMTKKQAEIRLKNWKVMIKKYREKGYSYPTISRIKKKITHISKNSNEQ